MLLHMGNDSNAYMKANHCDKMVQRCLSLKPIY